MKDSQYEDRDIKMHRIINENIINIPTYQRKLVWNMKRQELFIRNVLEGQPFGTVLIKEKKEQNEEGDDKITYDLVDGLQRISTLLKFHNNPLEYLKPSDINSEKIDELIREDLKLKEESMTEENISSIKEKIQQKIFDCIKGGLQNFQIMRILRNEFELSDDDNLEMIINDIYDEFIKYIDITELNIRAINYTGSPENIPNVFYHLNTGGVQLTKYDTYAALWNDTQFPGVDDELIELVVDKYTTLQEESELEVDFNEDSLPEEGITLHEYCYALGGIIINVDEGGDNDVRILFGKNKKSTDPTGFELLALLLTDNVNRADKLYCLLKDISPNFLVELKNTIKQSLIEIRTILKPLLEGMNQSSLNSGSDYQIYHMIVSYIKEYYDINLETEEINDKEDSTLSKEDFKKYAPLHYFYDCITDFWNINRQVTDLNREIEDENRRHKYWHKIPFNEWEEAIGKFMDSQDSSRRRIWQKNKLFIDFLTQMKVKKNNQEEYFSENNLSNNKYKLDFEHIVPKKVILDHIKDLPESQQKAYYVSPVGNLCYLTAKDNRSKKHKTLYEDIENRPSFVMNEDFLNCILYPSKEELDFIKYDNEDFRKAYTEFFKNRQNQLKEEFLSLIKVY